MSQNNYAAHSNQIKLDYSTKRILNTSNRKYVSGQNAVTKDVKK